MAHVELLNIHITVCNAAVYLQCLVTSQTNIIILIPEGPSKPWGPGISAFCSLSWHPWV